jgi:hypothetical protein
MPSPQSQFHVLSEADHQDFHQWLVMLPKVKGLPPGRSGSALGKSPCSLETDLCENRKELTVGSKVCTLARTRLPVTSDLQ